MTVLRRVLLALGGVSLLLVAVLFVSRNTQAVQVELLGLDFAPPLWVLLLGTFGAGAACCGAAFVLPLLRANLGARRARRALARLEAEIHALRNLPLAGAGAVAGEAAAPASALDGAESPQGAGAAPPGPKGADEAGV